MKENNSSYSHLQEDLRPRLSHLKVFGCVAYPMTTRAMEHVQSNKSISPFEQRAHIRYLLGYRASTQYVIRVPSMNTKKVVVSANVKFEYYPDREIDAR